MNFEKGWVKKFAKGLGYIILINQLAKPIAITVASNFSSLINTPNKASISELEFNPQIKTDSSFSTLDYLNLASYLTHHNLEENEKVCRFTANSTFDLYKKLIKRDEREDLESKIKLCMGININGGHEWIEYLSKSSQNWKTYETTTKMEKLDISLFKYYSNSIKNEKLNFDWKDAQTIPGTKIFYPTINSIKGFGLFGTLYGTINSFFKS